VEQSEVFQRLSPTSRANAEETKLAVEADLLCVHQLFESQAIVTPDAIALHFETRIVSYAELDSRANRLAYYLQSIGVSRNVLVGILLPRGVDLIVAMLGILKAGGAYVPLDPSYPQERLRFIVDDAQLSVLLTTEQLASQIPLGVNQIVRLSSQGEWPTSSEARSQLSTTTDSSDLVYVIYTSGSTGTPKGVLIEHHSLSNLVTSQQRSLSIGPGDRMLQLASSCFDVSVWEIFTALTSGTTLCLATSEHLQPGPDLIASLERMQITVAAFPVSVLASLAVTELPSLRTIVVGGEKCSVGLVARWAPGRQFINHYGPTEATVCSTTHHCIDCETDPPIGQPIDNVRVYLLNDDANPVASGEIGEIHIGGSGLARGYLNRPQLTSERFVTGLLRETPHERLYRTGDLARYREDGEIEFVGRADDQVKLRGFRIELGEIEASLLGHEDVTQAVVVMREDTAGVRRLVAYIVGSTRLELAKLKDRLETQLPSYMVPSTIIQLDSLPLTANGKVNRNSLPAPELVRVESQELVARNPIEQALAEIWCNVLGLETIGIHEHFVEVGGDSLLSVEISLRATKAGIALDPKHVLSYPTIANLAKFAQSRQ
jgi:amino acid adenylation domain-containing protein